MSTHQTLRQNVRSETFFLRHPWSVNTTRVMSHDPCSQPTSMYDVELTRSQSRIFHHSLIMRKSETLFQLKIDS